MLAVLTIFTNLNILIILTVTHTKEQPESPHQQYQVHKKGCLWSCTEISLKPLMSLMKGIIQWRTLKVNYLHFILRIFITKFILKKKI